MVSGNYITQEEIVYAYSEPQLIEWTRGGDVINENALEKAVQIAEAQVNSAITAYYGTKYTIPIVENPSECPHNIKSLALRLVKAYFLEINHLSGEQGNILWLDQIQQELNKISTGKLGLGIEPASATEDQARKIRFNSQEDRLPRQFKKEFLEGF